MSLKKLKNLIDAVWHILNALFIFDQILETLENMKDEKFPNQYNNLPHKENSNIKLIGYNHFISQMSSKTAIYQKKSYLNPPTCRASIHIFNISNTNKRLKYLFLLQNHKWSVDL